MAKSSDMTANTADRVVEEAVDLLQQLHFDEHEGGSREGDLVTVRATPERLDDHIRLLVTCYAHGHRIADWNRLRIAIAPQAEPDQLKFLPLLDERGQATVSGLTVNAYRLVPYFRVPHWFRLGAENQQAGAVARQVALVGRTIIGETVVTYETAATAAPQMALSAPAVIVNEPMRFVDSKGIQIDLTPDENGFTVNLTRDQDQRAGGKTELFVMAYSSIDTSDSATTLREQAIGQRHLSIQCLGNQAKQLQETPFELLFRILEPPAPI